jgi:hypothetical protein
MNTPQKKEFRIEASIHRASDRVLQAAEQWRTPAHGLSPRGLFPRRTAQMELV